MVFGGRNAETRGLPLSAPRTDGPAYGSTALTLPMIRLPLDRWNLSPMDRSFGTSGGRFLLWVDAVGGYWVCLGDEVVLGQPDPSARVDIPILGDLSARHARIRRDGEGYLIEALRETRVNGRRAEPSALLSDGATIALGETVRLLFRRPLALSATARLDFLSRHRTHPSSDAVLLMADTCVLGPKPTSHVVCRDWPCEVVLYRHEGELFCRVAGVASPSGKLQGQAAEAVFAIDGRGHRQRARIHPNARVAGEGFSFSLEAI